ncbi:hypothetical protein GALL_452430 [mine drainage metagenome]|uniref:Uncharacterized protein n=1 Tax=mine drainage metagenome TaxID=410659 RepID=A0A1J5PZU1_9ZZZZ
MHMVQPHRHLRHRLVRPQPQPHHRRADNIRHRHRRRVKAHRQRIIAALIARHLRPQPDRAELAPRRTAMLGRGEHSREPPPSAAQTIRAQRHRHRRDPRRGPRALGNPAPRAVVIPRGGPHPVHQIGAIGRVALHPGLDPLQPAIPPAQRFLQKSDAGSGHREMRIFMYPRPDNPLHRPRDILHQRGHRVLVTVAPAAHRQHRRRDRAKVLADRAVLPIGIPSLMAQPDCGQERLCRQPLQPHPLPVVAQRRVGRARGIAPHRRAPAEVLVQQTPTLVVNIIGIAIDRRTQRNDRLQRGRLHRRHLQAVEPAPADPLHPHRARTPRLRRDPRDHLTGVRQLLRAVFVVHQTIAVAIAAHIDPQAGIAVPRHIGMRQRIAHHGAIALAIGQEFKDRRHRPCPLGPPDPRRQTAAIRQDDAHVRLFSYGKGKLCNGLHSAPKFAPLSGTGFSPLSTLNSGDEASPLD